MTYVNLCSFCKNKFEWRAPRFDTPDPECPKCGHMLTRRCITAPAIIWSKPLSAYQDPRGETTAKDVVNGGHFVFERDSAEAQEKGAPIRRRIETVADQRNYCRREGLVMPSDLPSAGMTVAADGTSYETANVSEV